MLTYTLARADKNFSIYVENFANYEMTVKTRASQINK